MYVNRWLIILGMVIIIGMLVTGAFALGVYVGKHGWSQSGLEIQPPGNQPRPQPEGQNPTGGGVKSPQNAPNLPPGPPQVVGKLREFNPERILLATPDGLREVLIEPDTRFIEHTGESLAFSELKRGDILGVFGRLIREDGAVFLADILIRLPQNP
jgi:hypothetical protein